MLMRRAMELNPSDAYIKARCAGISTFIGEGEHSLKLLDEAEALDPLLPVWCIEERGIAYYALERYEEALEALGKLVFQTFRSRLYRAAALMALGRPDEAAHTGEGSDGEQAEPHRFGFHDEGALPRPHRPAPAAHAACGRPDCRL